jgi:hypothetical protein
MIRAQADIEKGGTGLEILLCYYLLLLIEISVEKNFIVYSSFQIRHEYNITHPSSIIFFETSFFGEIITSNILSELCIHSNNKYFQFD